MKITETVKKVYEAEVMLTSEDIQVSYRRVEVLK